jgi:hypothetical protein
MKNEKKILPYAETKITLNGVCKPAMHSVYSILLGLYFPRAWCGFHFGLSRVLQENVMSLLF